MKKLLQTSTLLLLFILTFSLAFADISTANALIDDADYTGAVAELEAIIEGDAENIEAHYTLASALTSLAATFDDPKEAEATYEKAATAALEAIKIDPNEAQGHYQRARALGRLAQFRGILQSLFMAGDIRSGFEKAIELDDQIGGAFHGLAVFHAQAPFIAGGDGSKAEGLFLRAIELDPEMPLRYLEYAEMLIERKEMDKAKEQLEILLSLENISADTAADMASGQALYDEHF